MTMNSDELNSDDVNINFNRLSDEIELAMDSEAPIQKIAYLTSEHG